MFVSTSERSIGALLRATIAISTLLVTGVLSQPVVADAGKEMSGDAMQKMDTALQPVAPSAQPTESKMDWRLESWLRDNVSRATDDMIAIKVHVHPNARAADLLAELEALGLTHGAAEGAQVVGLLPGKQLEAAMSLDATLFVGPADQAYTQAGDVTSQGDFVQRSDLAREFAGVNGSGVNVGVLSDSFNRLGGAPAGLSAGELPGAGNPNGFVTPIDVLAELPEALRGIDEGRAMMEIIHDVAPGAALKFATGFGGQAAMASNIRALAAADSDIIVDDVFYAGAPWFQDGLIAQAVNDARRAGISYFSSAGNQATNSYASEFRPSPVQALQGLGSTAPFADYILHDFDPGPGVDNFQQIVLGVGQALDLWLQWDDPFSSVCEGCPGAASEMDIVIAAFDNPESIISGFTLNSIITDAGGNPLGLDAFDRSGRLPSTGFYDGSLSDGQPLLLYVAIGKRLGGPGDNPDPRFIKWIDFGSGVAVSEYATDSPTIVGHPNARGAIAVGAASYRTVDPEAFFDIAEIESFSSEGGVRIRFDTDGRRIRPRARLKPEIVAPDDVNTSFFFAGRDIEGDGVPNFSGTSAAAPHAAAVGALMLEAAGRRLRPGLVRALMLRSAADMDDPATPRFDFSFDRRTGFGFLQADEAVYRASWFSSPYFSAR